MKNSSKEKCEIIVIGAGAAGISAAHHLYANGFKKLKILEASDRIGGRINTANFGKAENSIVELGANWIHGADDSNPMFKLAYSNGLLKPFVLLNRMEGTCYSEDGRAIDRKLVDRAWEMFEEINYEMDIYYKKDIKTQLNCFDFMKTRLTEVLDQFNEMDRSDVWSVFNCLINYLSFHCGQHLDKCSLYLMGNYEEITGGNVKLPYGYSSVLQTLTKDLPENMIQFNKEVTMIQWSKHDDVKPVTVHCNYGQDVYTADHLIVTVSLGVLKRTSATLFKPALPEKKVSAITYMGFGIVNKLFLYFDQPFWKLGEGSIKPAWSGDNSKISRDTWYKHIFAFDEVLNNTQVLSAWVYGEAAEFLEQTSDTDILDTCHRLICQFLNNKEIPRPSKVLRSSWQSYPYARGSYSYFDIESHGDEPDVIAEPLYSNDESPIVLFAGEATHRTWFSTTHGARASGIREARRLETIYENC